MSEHNPSEQDSLQKAADGSLQKADDGSSTEHTVTRFPRRQGLKRGVYLLPNLITTAALFAGFYAIIAAMSGFFTAACLAIVIAGFLDAVDGRIARLT
ncbi:MAG: CDP-alcohol phosphatidyltransferase family protein, partial [Pseudomonadales bacterium]